ncbi:MAG TPA: PIG-L deacetylase family protein [Acidimicrobiales bacterium]|nr:PIG-L deacetylase family protein [Acidimicrobiales bacterium]
MADAEPHPSSTDASAAARRARGFGTVDPETTIVAPDAVGRVLVVTAHPDDVDFGAAGSVAAYTKAGVAVAYCIVTDGDAGGSDRAMSRAAMAALRREEQRAAAAEVGVEDVSFLGYPDGRVVPSLELRRDISREIRRFRPDRVVCPSPERNWDRIVASHPDHLAAGEATVCAVYPDARNPFAHPELLDEGHEPFAVPELWLMASPLSNRAVEITDTFDQKLRALRCHRSQVGDGEHLEGLLRGWFGPQAQALGLPEGHYAELFRAVDSG